MKIIDKTSQQDVNGNINIVARVQGTLKYGLNWFAELEAQKKVMAQLDRVFEKGFVLIRNFTLPNSEIVIPIILIGTGGIWVIYVTNVKGSFEANDDQWNTLNNDGRAQPAPINYIARATQLANVFQKFLKIKKVEIPSPLEPVLIAANPGAQIESVRPVLRVVRSDAVRQFATSLLQTPPIWRTDFIHELADRILDTTSPDDLKILTPTSASQQNISRAAALAQTAEQDFSANQFGFTFEESQEHPPEVQPVSLSADEEIRPYPNRTAEPSAKKKFFGLKDTQIILLAGMFIVEICILFGFGIIIYLNL